MIVLIYSCEKDETNEDNNPPICAIASPIDGEEITKGEIVNISVSAADPEGDVSVIRFIVDGVDIGSTNSFPYNHDWNTANVEAGNHILKAIAVDNSNNEGVDEITVEITDSGGGGETFTDPRDNQTYKTVIIGGQEWFAENLNYESASSWCYNDSSQYCDEYGRLYSWYAALDACPQGWHLPSDEEWKALEIFIGMPADIADWWGSRGTDEGRKLKSTTGWANEGNGTDEFGFTVTAGSSRNSNLGVFGNVRAQAHFWTATTRNDELAWDRIFTWSNDKIERGKHYKIDGKSVRCVKD